MHDENRHRCRRHPREPASEPDGRRSRFGEFLANFVREAGDVSVVEIGRQTSFLVAPLTLLSLSVAEGLVVIAGVLAVVATLLALDVRDWRCYVVAFLWVAVLNAIGLGNLTIFLVLCAALIWRFRDRDALGASTLGAALAAKLFLWPLVVWLTATRCTTSAAITVAVWLGLLVVSWAVIGFAGLVDYVDVLRIARSLWADDGYSVYALALDAGASDRSAGLLGLAVAASLLAASVMRGRHGADRAAFILAIAAALAFSPIVWRHYFAFLLVVVGVARPRLGVLWFLPLLMWPVSEGIGNGTALQTSATLAIAATTIGLALWSVRDAPGHATVVVEGTVAARPL